MNKKSLKNLLPEPLNHIKNISPYCEGKTRNKKNKVNSNVIKLSSNEVLWGASLKAINIIEKEAKNIHLYPKRQSSDLKKKIGSFLKVKENNIVLGNGSNEVIQFLISSFTKPGDNVLIPKLTFSMYKIYSEIFNIKTKLILCDSTFNIDLNKIQKEVNSKTKIIFLCSPNNPTGLILDKKELLKFLNSIPKSIIVVIDEAYADFCDKKFRLNISSIIKKYTNILFLRTFSKAFGLAGLRVGYGIANSSLIQTLIKVSQPFNVNSLAVKASIESLKDLTHYKKVIKEVERQREFIQTELKKNNIKFIKSYANFIMIYVKDSNKVFELLSKENIFIRDLTSFGLSGYIRMTISSKKHNVLFLKSLKEAMKLIQPCRNC